MTDNERRAEHGFRIALYAHNGDSDSMCDEDGAAFIDAVSDLLHAAEEHGHAAADVARIALDHYQSETAGA